MIKITTDSTCDLPRSLLEQHDITVIPLGIVKAGRLYQDGVDIRIEDIAAHVDAGGDITTTNAVNIADYEDVFRRMTERYDAVIHINIGMQFSSCHQNAKLAAEEVPEVYVVDSSNLTVGHGMLVLAAAEAAEAGKSVSEILDLVANLLKLHPCVEVIGGKMSVTKKYRGSMEKVVGDYVRERLTGRTDIDTRRIFLVDTCRTPGLREAAKASLEADGRFQEIIESKAGCTIFCHCGPDTLGIIFLRK